MKKKEVDFYVAFDWRLFIRVFSYREILTASTLALAILALGSIVEYYQSENSFWSGWHEIRVWTYFLVIPVLHLVYRIEHKRSNNYIGRGMHDWLYLIILFGLYRLSEFIRTGENNVQVDPGTLFFVLFFGGAFLMALELFVALIKWLLRLAGWRLF